jgi:hypothetical protein
VDALCEAWSLPAVAEPAEKQAEAPAEPVTPARAVEESKSAERRQSEPSAVGGK